MSLPLNELDAILRGEQEAPYCFSAEDSRLGKRSGDVCKAKAKEIKAAIRRRSEMSDQEYRDLLVDRRRRLEVIKTLFPVITDRDAMHRLGANDQVWVSTYMFLLESDLEGVLTDTISALHELEKAIFDNGLTRKTVHWGFRLLGPLSRRLEKAEFIVDFWSWYFKSPISVLANLFLEFHGEDRKRLLTDVDLAKGIREVADRRLTVPAHTMTRTSNPDHEWRIGAEDAQRMKRLFPSIAYKIDAGTFR